MKSGQLIVRNHHPRRRQALILLVFAIILLVGWSLFELGQYRGGFNRLAALEAEHVLDEQIVRMEDERRRLSEQLSIARMGLEVDQAAYKDVRDGLRSLQEEILELREEVEFYRGIVSPSERQAGLNIQNFTLFPAGEENLYHYELVLTQVLKNDRTIKGVARLVLQGVQNGEPVEMPFSKISPNNSVKDAFRFRYFQKLEGDIRLPKGFVARMVQVELAPQKRSKINKSFLWVVNGG